MVEMGLQMSQASNGEPFSIFSDTDSTLWHVCPGFATTLQAFQVSFCTIFYWILHAIFFSSVLGIKSRALSVSYIWSTLYIFLFWLRVLLGHQVAQLGLNLVPFSPCFSEFWGYTGANMLSPNSLFRFLSLLSDTEPSPNKWINQYAGEIFTIQHTYQNNVNELKFHKHIDWRRGTKHAVIPILGVCVDL